MGKADRVNHRTRKSKRRFKGNQFTRKSTPDCHCTSQQQQLNEEVEVTDQPMNDHAEPVLKTPQKTASISKIEAFETDTPKKTDKVITGYRFVDMEILSTMVSMLCCPLCQSHTLRLHECFVRKMGFASLLTINCKERRM